MLTTKEREELMLVFSDNEKFNENIKSIYDLMNFAIKTRGEPSIRRSLFHAFVDSSKEFNRLISTSDDLLQILLEFKDRVEEKTILLDLIFENLPKFIKTLRPDNMLKIFWELKDYPYIINLLATLILLEEKIAASLPEEWRSLFILLKAAKSSDILLQYFIENSSEFHFLLSPDYIWRTLKESKNLHFKQCLTNYLVANPYEIIRLIKKGDLIRIFRELNDCSFGKAILLKFLMNNPDEFRRIIQPGDLLEIINDLKNELIFFKSKLMSYVMSNPDEFNRLVTAGTLMHYDIEFHKPSFTLELVNYLMKRPHEFKRVVTADDIIYFINNRLVESNQAEKTLMEFLLTNLDILSKIAKPGFMESLFSALKRQPDYQIELIQLIINNSATFKILMMNNLDLCSTIIKLKNHPEIKNQLCRMFLNEIFKTENEYERVALGDDSFIQKYFKGYDTIFNEELKSGVIGQFINLVQGSTSKLWKDRYKERALVGALTTSISEFSQLPNELIAHISGYLDPKYGPKLARVNKFAFKLALDEPVVDKSKSSDAIECDISTLKLGS